MKNKCLVLFFLAFLVSYTVSAQKLISNKMIWKGNNYAAFTSLVHYKGYFYCAFREANKHVDASGKDNGIIRIIKSKDGDNWDEFITINADGYDLRDPQLSVTPQKTLMLLTEKVLYKDGKAQQRNSCTSTIDKNGSYSPLMPILYKESPNWNWLWNITWINGKAYGFTYCPSFSFVNSTDGKSFQTLNNFQIEGMPTEASVIKWKRNHFLAVVRRTENSLIGIYDTRFKQWEWKDAGAKIECPQLIAVKRKVYLLGRGYNGGEKTAIYRFDEIESRFYKVLGIKGDKDCAYPGAIYRNGVLFVSYYKGDEKQGDIYIAKVLFKE